MLDAFVSGIRFNSVRRDDGSDVLEKAHTAFLASAALTLLMPARRALIPERCMALLAEARYVAYVGFALGALHAPILSMVGPYRDACAAFMMRLR